MNNQTLLYIVIIAIALYLLSKLFTQDSNEPFYSYGIGARRNKPWFGAERRFGSYNWRFPYSFYNTYPNWFYNAYVEPAFSTDPVYIVTDVTSRCKKNCIDKYSDSESELTKDNIKKIKECVKKC